MELVVDDEDAEPSRCHLAWRSPAGGRAAPPRPGARRRTEAPPPPRRGASRRMSPPNASTISADGEAEPGPLPARLGREERLEDPRQVRGRHAGAAVRDDEPRSPRPPRAADIAPRPRRRARRRR